MKTTGSGGSILRGHQQSSLRAFRYDWQSGLYALVGSLPMMAVATVWMLSAEVLYMPYVDIVCQWNISPLADQHWAGFVMLAMGFPLQIAAAWRLAQLNEPAFQSEARLHRDLKKPR